jgi:hypothetical protein
MRLGAEFVGLCPGFGESGVSVKAGPIQVLATMATKGLEPLGICAGIPPRMEQETLRSVVPMSAR